MNKQDLAELDGLLSSASAVVSMREVHAGATGDDVIGLRHDVDDNPGSLDTAAEIAAWEAERGYTSTFFILHTASYWHRPDLVDVLSEIAGHGHEIGIHANAITYALKTGGDPVLILTGALEWLRRNGFEITGVAPHGDQLCYATAPEGQKLGFVNDELFTECPRPELGAPDRVIEYERTKVRLRPEPLSLFGLDYETYRLPHGRYLSDSGGKWNVPPASVMEGPGQLHILQHPDWWREAFA